MITVRTIYRRGASPPPAATLDHLQGAAEPISSRPGESRAVYSEIVLPPAATVQREANFDGEIVVYVRRGTVRCIDSTGHAHVTRAGVFMSASVRSGDALVQGNESPTEDAQLIVIGVRSEEAASSVFDEQRRVTAAQRRNRLCVVASRDGEAESLRLSENARVYSALLLRGQHVVHELERGRRVWLQVIEGDVQIGDHRVASGDGVSVTSERVVSITARAEAELLLVDLGDERSRPTDSPH